MPTDNSNSGSSGSGSGGSASSGSGSSGSGSGGSSGAGATPTDLTKDLKSLQDNGPKDVKLSADAKDKFIKITGDFLNGLNTEKKNMANMVDLGNPGTFSSAGQTKQNLLSDISGFDGVEPTMDKLIAYLEALQTTVDTWASASSATT